MATEAMEILIKEARDVGVSKDQLTRFLNASYVPFPWQLEFHAEARKCDDKDGPNDIGVGGARGPGKSHSVLAQVLIDDLQRVPGLKALFLRSTGVSATESFEDLLQRIVFQKIPYTFNRANNTLKFLNGSRVLLGGFKDDKDIDKYVGIEYDLMAIEELNLLTKEKVEKLRGSLRTSKENWRPRLYTSFNPGGIGHVWVKDRYITNRPERVRFFPATYKANPFLDEGYVEYLEGLTGDLGKAWREGEFDLFAGQYFEEWRHKIHVVKPFTIPEDWKRFIMGDYGYGAPAAIYWGAISPDEQIYLYRELYVTKRTYAKLTEEIVSLTNPSEKIDYWVFDPSIWSRKGENSDELSGAEIMMQTYRNITKTSLNLIKGVNDRINGWGVVRDYLKPYLDKDNITTTAKLQVFSTCSEFIRTFPSLIYDEHRIEDLNTDLEDHAADAVRYGLMSRPKPSKTSEERQRDFFNKKMALNKKKKGGTIFKMTNY